jgi:aerobic carbon-monoxide dehydrogenase medium subunit
VKPASFDYVRPTSLSEAIEVLASSGHDGKVIAGGQSLVPAMNFRLIQPRVLIDITSVPGLAGISERESEIVIGALTTHSDVETNRLDGATGRLLADMARWVGHVPIRSRGTFGGSLAHADPAAEWGVLAAALDAMVEVDGPRGSRTILAKDFFKSVFTTALEPDEIIISVRVPVLEGASFGFRESAPRSGDFAEVAVLVALAMGPDGSIGDARVALGGVASTPVRARAAESFVTGRPRLSPEVIEEAAGLAAEGLDPPGDSRVSTEFRRKLVRSLARSSLLEAGASAGVA